MKAVLQLSASISLLSLALIGFKGMVLLEEVAAQTVSSEKRLNDDVHSLTIKIGALSSKSTLLAGQLVSTSAQLNKSLISLDLSQKLALQSFNKTLTTTDRSLETLTEASNELLSNPDNAKVIRDARQTLAITGHAMSHISSVADTVAVAAPTMVESANGIAEDVHKVTEDFVKPKPWWKKALTYVGDAVKIGGVVIR
jgi:hypothetical protein